MTKSELPVRVPVPEGLSLSADMVAVWMFQAIGIPSEHWQVLCSVTSSLTYIVKEARFRDERSALLFRLRFGV